MARHDDGKSSVKRSAQFVRYASASERAPSAALHTCQTHVAWQSFPVAEDRSYGAAAHPEYPDTGERPRVAKRTIRDLINIRASAPCALRISMGERDINTREIRPRTGTVPSEAPRHFRSRHGFFFISPSTCTRIV